jgi:hypothetical protein
MTNKPGGEWKRVHTSPLIVNPFLFRNCCVRPCVSVRLEIREWHPRHNTETLSYVTHEHRCQTFSAVLLPVRFFSWTAAWFRLNMILEIYTKVFRHTQFNFSLHRPLLYTTVNRKLPNCSETSNHTNTFPAYSRDLVKIRKLLTEHLSGVGSTLLRIRSAPGLNLREVPCSNLDCRMLHWLFLCFSCVPADQIPS